MPMLASDLMNPLFVGARNPDELLAVEFYWAVVKDFRGRPVLEKDGTEKKRVHVKISVPGNDTSMVDTPVHEDHKRRFARQWQYWQVEQGANEPTDAAGWKLEDWSELNDEQRRELKYLRFSVVEQIAQASDLSLQRTGDGMALRAKARKALKQRADDEQAREIAKREKEINDLNASMAAMQLQMATLVTAQPAPQDPPAEPVTPAVEARRKPGRPPKDKEAA